MAEKKAGSGGYIGTRGEDFTMAPGKNHIFSKLVIPDTYEGKESFKLVIMYNDPSLEILIDRSDAMIGHLWPKFVKEAEASPKPPKNMTPPSAREWLEGKLKEQGEKARDKTPYMTISVDADYLDRDKQIKRRKILAWDGRNNPLDLATLGLGAGSIVQPVVQMKLFTSALIKDPTPSIKLVGVKVLKLERFTGGGPALDTVSDADLAALGEGFEMDDLSAYLGDSSAAAQTAAPRESFAADLDDDIPF